MSVNELLTICVQEEEKLKHDILVKVNMATHDKGSASKGTKWYDLSKVKRKQPMKIKNNMPICKKKGYVKKDCLNYRNDCWR